MKKLLLTLFSFLLIFSFFACSEEEKVEYGSYVDPNKQVLAVTENHVTSSTFTFSVEASDPEIPYLALYVDKATIDDVPKSDLPSYLMEEMQSQATTLGKTLEAHLDSVSVKGNLVEKKISNLVPGQIYELVVFAFSGSKPANHAETLFFQTLKADPVDCSFDVVITDVQAHNVKMTVEPSLSDKEWFLTAVYKEDYEKYINDYSFSNEYIIQNIFAQQYESVLAQLAQGDINNVTDALINEALDALLFKGKQNVQMSGIMSERNFVYLIAAYDRAVIDGVTEPVLLSAATTGEFSTPKDPYNDVTFELKAEVHDGVMATIDVIPSDKTQKFFWIYDSFNAENINYSAEEMAQFYVKQYGSFMQIMANYKGDQHLEGTVTPGTKNYILAFTYDQGITSVPAMYTYDVPEAGNPEDMLISYGNEEISAYSLTINTSVSDKTVLYGTAVVKASEYDEVEFKASVESSIASGYEMNAQYNPQMTMESYLYSQNVYRPGDKKLEFSPLQAGTLYKVCSFVLNKEGKVVRIISMDYETSALSDATVGMKVEGIFDGDDAAEIFGDESAKGIAVVAIRYSLGENSYDATYGTTLDNDKMTESMDDYSLLASNFVSWNSVGKSGLSFTKCDWNNGYYSFAYAKDENGIEGKMTRTYIDKLSKFNAGTKEQLQALYDETKDGSEVSRSGMAVWNKQKYVPYVPAKVISIEKVANLYLGKPGKVGLMKPEQNQTKTNQFFFDKGLSLVKAVF